MEIKIKLNDSAFMPEKKSEHAAAYDLRVSEDRMLLQKGRYIVPTGVSLEMPKQIKANVRARSGFSVKGLEAYRFVRDSNYNTIAEAEPVHIDADVILGLIDSDYRGEVGVIVKYNGDCPVIIKRGTRIAQLEFCVVPCTELVQVSSLSETERGKGGFGHSGTN